MTETVLQSLITAGAGFFGALLGAVGAVFGPWWLRRSERRSETDRADKEARRSAIVEYIDAQVALANHISPADEETARRALRANAALVELSSLIEDEGVAEWLHGLGGMSKTTDSDFRRYAYGTGGRLLTAWHHGNIGPDKLKPFMVYKKGFEFREEWPTLAEQSAGLVNAPANAKLVSEL